MFNPKNPPAFPRPMGKGPDGVWQSGTDGMTLRDWFAGQAITVLAATGYKSKIVAEQAYEIADAMLQARED